MTDFILREDGTKFGTLEDGLAAHGPMTLSGSGTHVPALDSALPGMCLGERRMVSRERDNEGI